MRRLGGTFSRLLDELVRERTGLASSRRHEEVKQRVLDKAMARAGVSDEAVYLALLKRDRKAYDDLIADLTVPETYFFRDPAHYELLRREVLPAILRAHDDRHVLELWSAGCASGEEPYSLAILLEQQRLGERSHVLGTDVSFRALARAMQGVYTRWSLRATSPTDRDRYFESRGAEHRLIPRIRASARFVQHSLSSPVYPSPQSRNAGFDLILCRNVLIYFDPQATVDTAQRLARSLNEDGWLMTGPSDPMLELEEWCDAVPTPCGMSYRRRRTGAEAPARPRADVLRRLPGAPHVWHSQASSARRTRALHEGPVVAPAPSRSGSPDRAPLPVPRPDSESRRDTPADVRATPNVERAAQVDSIEQVRALEREHGSLAAEAGCRDLLATEPLSAGLHVVHAMLLLDLGRDSLAEQALRRASYLDRSLLIAQLVGATLAERRGERAAAGVAYTQLAEACSERPQDELVRLGEGLTHASLGVLARQRARSLSGAASETREL
jgi:chemotaxis protein methyltransferase CheR